jgi:glycosyltransferase involved in cell wall biosynthesis
VGRLLENPDLARSMGAAGRARAVRLYDQRFVQKRFVEVIQNFLKQQYSAMGAAEDANRS